MGIPRIVLSRAVRNGQLQRLSRGLYGLASHPLQSAHATLAEVSLRVPHGVICLLSALRFHELTTQAPFQVWLAIDGKAARPRLDYPPLRIVRFSGQALTEGIEIHRIDRVSVSVTSIERTVVDCFKYRNKIGLDVALEAMHEAWRSKRLMLDDVWRHAAQNRMTRVMRPYLESLAS